MEKSFLNFTDYISSRFGQGAEYFITALFIIALFLAYIIPEYLRYKKAEREKMLDKGRKREWRNLKIIALVIAFLLVIGYFCIPFVSKSIWDYANDGRPSVEEKIKEQNKFLQDIKK